MHQGIVEYSKGLEYISELEGCITDNSGDVKHRMEIQLNEFTKHFTEV